MKSKKKKLLESLVNRRAKLLENHVLGLGVLPSSKLMKMKWNPVTQATPLREQESPMENDIISELKNILATWETKEYPSDKARWQEYYKDIQNVVNKFAGA